MDCPICLRATEADPCECGYAFGTREVEEAARRAARVADKARAKLVTGVGVLLTMPLTVLLVVAFPIQPIPAIAFLAFPAQLIVGLGSIARGWTWGRSARKRIQRTRTLAALPAARVVLRD